MVDPIYTRNSTSNVRVAPNSSMPSPHKTAPLPTYSVSSLQGSRSCFSRTQNKIACFLLSIKNFFSNTWKKILDLFIKQREQINQPLKPSLQPNAISTPNSPRNGPTENTPPLSTIPCLSPRQSSQSPPSHTTGITIPPLNLWASYPCPSSPVNTPPSSAILQQPLLSTASTSPLIPADLAPSHSPSPSTPRLQPLVPANESTENSPTVPLRPFPRAIFEQVDPAQLSPSRMFSSTALFPNHRISSPRSAREVASFNFQGFSSLRDLAHPYGSEAIHRNLGTDGERHNLTPTERDLTPTERDYYFQWSQDQGVEHARNPIVKLVIECSSAFLEKGENICRTEQQICGLLINYLHLLVPNRSQTQQEAKNLEDLEADLQTACREHQNNSQLKILTQILADTLKDCKNLQTKGLYENFTSQLISQPMIELGEGGEEPHVFTKAILENHLLPIPNPKCPYTNTSWNDLIGNDPETGRPYRRTNPLKELTLSQEKIGERFQENTALQNKIYDGLLKLREEIEAVFPR
jgi:hypothetical protein